jgi:hypothetical protein
VPEVLYIAFDQASVLFNLDVNSALRVQQTLIDCYKLRQPGEIDGFPLRALLGALKAGDGVHLLAEFRQQLYLLLNLAQPATRTLNCLGW